VLRVEADLGYGSLVLHRPQTDALRLFVFKIVEVASYVSIAVHKRG